MTRRSDFGAPADRYFNDLSPGLRPLATELRTLILEALPKATECMKWGVPVYEQGGLVCAIRTTRKYAALQFYEEGIALDDPDGLLEGTGKRLRHVKIHTLKDIRKRQFKSWLKHAARLQKQ